jgi:dsRNA-specific ribonuclease
MVAITCSFVDFGRDFVVEIRLRPVRAGNRMSDELEKEELEEELEKEELEKSEYSQEEESGVYSSSSSFVVEKILDHRKDNRGRRRFLVKWEGYDHENNSWVKEEDMECPE